MDRAGRGLRETLPVAGGLALIALSGYAVLAMAGHALGPAEYAAVGSLYLLVSILGPGIFVAVEQQTIREVAGRAAAGVGWRAALRTSSLVSARLAAVVTLALAVASPLLVPRVFGGSWTLLGGCLLAVWGAAAGYPLRGLYGGLRRYGWYGATMGVEGLARIAAAAGLVWLGIGADGGAGDAGPGDAGAGWYGLVFGLALVVSAGVTAAGLRGGDAGSDGPAPGVRRMSGQVALLAGASALTLVVANLGPVVLTSRLGPADAPLAASFVSLFVLARIPVLLVTPLQAVLLPRLTEAAERGELDEVRRVVRGALLTLLALAVPGVAAWVLLGPWAAEMFFAAPARLSPLVAALLGLGTVGMVAAQLVTPALVALGRNRAATTAWGVGTAVFVVLLAGPGMPLAWTVAAQALAPAVVCVLMLRAVGRRFDVPSLSTGSPTPETVSDIR